MKLVFVGGGSHRYLSVARSILAVDGLMDNGEINLYDLAVERAEAVGKMIMKCPEYKTINCKITWGTTLDEALEGADIVYVVLMAGSRKNFRLLSAESIKHGFLASDQLSPSGAIFALKGGPILLDIAQRMERLCPNALLADFANPVAVLSAAVNNHTKIKCMGVCAGYTNHQWDLPRILLGEDKHSTDFDILSAGVNHMSFILPGSTYKGKDLYELAKETITDDWRMCPLSDRWSEQTKRMVSQGMYRLVNMYRKYGYFIFSSEGDGMAHLDMEGHYFSSVKEAQSQCVSEKSVEEEIEEERTRRKEADKKFNAWLNIDMTDEDWNRESPETLYLLREDENVMVKIAKAVGGIKNLKIATSTLNNGAVIGFKDKTVLEYTQILDEHGLRPVKTFEIPDVFQGLVSSLAMHQTLLGDAIATKDPHVLFQALYSYPVKQDTAESKALWRSLLSVAADEIPSEFQETKKMFR